MNDRNDRIAKNAMATVDVFSSLILMRRLVSATSGSLAKNVKSTSRVINHI